MKRYRIDLSYKGTNYHGWQVQKNANTVQAELNRALSVLLNSEIETIGCGRTDTGVHAKTYTAHFDCKEIDCTQELIFKLNCILPQDIAVSELQETSPKFHARFDAVERTYKYFIHRRKSVFIDEFSYFFPSQLDILAMNEAGQELIGTHDFSSFCKQHSGAKTGICTLRLAIWSKEDDETLVFSMSADRFLRNMVRATVGTLLDVGLGKISHKTFIEIFKAGNRSKAGVSVPAKGLFLWDIEY
ncbi:MAG: tRNA pseudouridine(38-40) synthase TruA [Prevotellaceae bacterium]|jgi:tRNA pseudouridine38-40 synthase|nr:tRNA pseudouridine(38-40) synthase TruA [Prevotellaceae bacterium]